MTPRQLLALWEAWKVRERSWDRRAALMPWLYASAHRDPKRDSPKIEDFMPGTADAPADDPEARARQNLETFKAGLGPIKLTAKEVSAEEFAAMAGKRYTKPKP